MRILSMFGEVLPVLGTVGLLGLWLYQQVGIERRSAELQRLAAARAVYQTYQSNNALFNAINELTSKDKKASEQLRVFQVYNYELGLAAIEEALPASDKADIPPSASAYDSTENFQTKMERTQKRLEKLQDKLAERQAMIRELAETAKKTYLWLYIGLSLFAILGAVCKVVEKLSVAPT